jgi:alkylhydroperoxidase family enzyme
MTEDSMSPPGRRAQAAKSTADIARRTAEVLGNGPRIAPIEIDELSDGLQAILSRMAQVNVAIDSRDKEMLTDLIAPDDADRPAADVATDVRNLPEIVRTMLHHGDLFAVQTDIGIQLLARGALTPRDRELAVLRIGWLCQAPYEWGEHVMVAKKVGISSDEIERITQGSGAPGWTRHERAILCATEELYRDSMISDSTWAVLASSLDERQLIELPILVGQYQAVAYYQNSLRLRLHEGNAGLNAR